MKRSACFLPLFLLLEAVTAGKDFWEEKPYTEWSKEEATKMLQNSPWSKAYTEVVSQRPTSHADITGSTPYPQQPYPRPGTTSGGEGYETERRVAGYEGGFPPASDQGGLGTAIRVQYLITWFSATPVRQAQARLAQLRGGASPEKIEDFVNAPKEDLVIAVFGDADRFLSMLTIEEAKKGAYLKVSSLKDKVYAINYMAPQQGQPALFFFPREIDGKPVVTAADKEVSFNLEVGPKTLRAKFKPKDMVFKGKLDL